MPKLLMVTNLPFYPEWGGGAELTNYNLVEGLRRRGWEVEVICRLSGRSPRHRALRRERRRGRLQGRRVPAFVLDEDLGFRCWRGMPGSLHARCFLVRTAQRALAYAGLRAASRSQRLRGCAPPGLKVICSAELEPMRDWLLHRLDEFRPDAVLGQMDAYTLAAEAARAGVPTFFFARGRSVVARRHELLAGVHVVVNSPSVAAANPGPEPAPIIRSIVPPERYRALERERRYITFVNPVPEKGLAVALEIARRLPQERFLFVRGGWFDHEHSLATRLRARGMRQLSNVEVWDYQQDMRRVYGATDILLVPSRYESFCRVILEAHINAIPVVGSNVGAIPDTMGAGGILVDPAGGAEGYVDALRRLRNDESLYAELSRRALENSLRPEYDPEHQVETLARFIESRLAGRAVSTMAPG